MIKFVIVEDNKRHAKKVKDIIVSFMMNNKIDFEFEMYTDNTKELRDFIKARKYDSIYILDLELPVGDGLEVARYIRNTVNDWKSPIIICTAHTSLLFEVYKQRLQILDFMGKCFDVDTMLRENLELCLKMLNKDTVLRFTYRNVEYTIEYNKINYIQRYGRKSMIITKEDKYYCNIPIRQIKNELPSFFLVSNKGTLINMKNVEKLNWNECCAYFKDNTFDYVISRKHKKELDSYRD